MGFVDALIYMTTYYLYKITNKQWFICLFCVFCITLCVCRFMKIKFIQWYTVICIFYITGIVAITFLGRSFNCIESSLDTLFITYKVILYGDNSWEVYEVIFNVLLFVPAGVLLLCKCRPLKCISMIFFVSLLIETIQLITGTGVFEICDLIDNTLGGIIGIGIAMAFQRMRKMIKCLRI